MNAAAVSPAKATTERVLEKCKTAVRRLVPEATLHPLRQPRPRRRVTCIRL